jgi:hypothetical protein
VTRLSRHCYDKPHRCPGWAGGGARHAKVNRCPDGGYIALHYATRAWKWRFHRCNKCDVLCWPIVVRELDWRWWRWRLVGFRRDWLSEHVLWPVQKALVITLRSERLDERWKTNVWERAPEEER